jgi:uncharacterized protein YjbI with pentapeptide repeats
MTDELLDARRMTKKARAARWDPAQPLDVSSAPFGWTEDGYRDFRGAPINRYRKVLGRRFMKCDLSEADFSKIELKGLEFADCRFTSTNFTSTNDKGNQFFGCLFTKCSFYDAYLGMRPRRRSEPSRYEDCVFTQNNFTKALFRNAIFRRTVFEDNRMKGVDFCASGFWDCRFVGLVEDVWFRGGYPHPANYKDYGAPIETGLHRVDFSRARLVMLGISDGCALDEIILPADGSCVLSNNGKLLKDSAQFSIGFGDDSALVAQMVEWLNVYAEPNGLSTPQDTGILCLHDMEAYFSGFTKRNAELAATVFDQIKSRYGVDCR